MADTHATADTHAAEGAHATVATYVRVAVVLTVITAIEVADALRPGIPPRRPRDQPARSCPLVKFALVVVFYMHLRYDYAAS